MSIDAQSFEPSVRARPTGPTRLWREVLRRPLGIASVVFLIGIALACAFANVVAPYDPLNLDLTAVHSGPTSSHWFGTDQLGRDILSRILFGGRESLLAVLTAVAVYLAIGLPVGLFTGYVGGALDRIVMRVVDLMLSIPAFIILLVVLAVVGNNEIAAMVAFGILTSPSLVRITRATTLAVRSEQFVAAARVAGRTTPQILFRHILPHTLEPVTTAASLLAGSTLLVESGLTFLGLGVRPPTPSWGGLVADASQAIDQSAWMLVPTGGVIAATIIAFGLFGDVLRDASASRATGTAAHGPLSWRTMRTRVVTAPPAESAQELQRSTRPLLSVRDLSVSRPAPGGRVKIVDNVSFDLEPGEALGIVGESGCGKSITVSALLRLLPPETRLTARTYCFNDTDLLSLSERQMSGIRGRRIGYISQEPVASLDPSFTVGAQITEAVRHHRQLPRKRAAQYAMELLRKVRLPDPAAAAAKYPHELSGGMAQRVAIARALTGDPQLLIADEPTTALDVTIQAEILDLLRDLREQTGMALILVTHDWGVLAEACDSALVLYAGEIVEKAAVGDLHASPRHPYTAALLEANPENAPRGEPLPTIPGAVPIPDSWPSGCRFAPRCAFADSSCQANRIDLYTTTSGAAWRCIHSDHITTVRSGSHGNLTTA